VPVLAGSPVLLFLKKSGPTCLRLPNALGRKLAMLYAPTSLDIDAAFTTLSQRQAEALVVGETWPTRGASMQCSRCRADNRSGRRFCAACGAPLAAPCGACGFSNEPEERFCGGCGRPLTSAEPPTARAPDTHTPSYLAEKI
jgi:predicted amidophosphoribosyltransferase